MRSGLLSVLLWAGATGAQADGVTAARYLSPTGIYGHNVVPGGEYATLEVTTGSGVTTVTYDRAVFEDTAPRIVDLDGDGNAEVVTVVSDFAVGARVQVFGVVDGVVAPVVANDPIGRRFRWLAIAGVTDVDGDGAIEIVYVDRPHLAKTLRVFEVGRDGDAWTIREEGAFAGVTNHRIGEPDIAGGIRTCAGAPEVLVASADWQRLLAVRFDGDFTVEGLGSDTSRPAFAAAMTCDN